MKPAYALVLLLLAIGAASLATASAASAQVNTVEVFREGTGTEACNPCEVHLTGETSIIALPLGLEVTKCQDELEGTINHDGTGELTWTGTTHDPVGPGCTLVSCIDGEDHWPLSSLFEVESEARVTLRACYRTSTGVQIHCDLVVTIPETPTHDQQLTTDQLCVSNTRRVEANWQTETTAHDSLELVHGEGSAVEVLREVPVNEPCNPCEIHLAGETSAIALPSGLEIGKCQDELEGTINHDGTGELAWTPAPHDPVGPGCTAGNCIDGEDHWPLSLLLEVEGDARVTLRACYRSTVNGAEVHCDLVVTIPETPTHDQQLTTDQLCLSNTRRIEVNWQTETAAHDSLELVHGDQ